jgi:hypothetical protein
VLDVVDVGAVGEGRIHVDAGEQAKIRAGKEVSAACLARAWRAAVTAGG